MDGLSNTFSDIRLVRGVGVGIQVGRIQYLCVYLLYYDFFLCRCLFFLVIIQYFLQGRLMLLFLVMFKFLFWGLDGVQLVEFVFYFIFNINFYEELKKRKLIRVLVVLYQIRIVFGIVYIFEFYRNEQRQI